MITMIIIIIIMIAKMFAKESESAKFERGQSAESESAIQQILTQPILVWRLTVRGPWSSNI